MCPMFEQSQLDLQVLSWDYNPITKHSGLIVATLTQDAFSFYYICFACYFIYIHMADTHNMLEVYECFHVQ